MLFHHLQFFKIIFCLYNLNTCVNQNVGVYNLKNEKDKDVTVLFMRINLDQPQCKQNLRRKKNKFFTFVCKYMFGEPLVSHF